MWPSDLIGRQIKDYVIQERIGQGGMAHVYRASQTSVNRDVAIKLIHNDRTADQSFVQRFAQEASTIASLEHIHILPIYDYGIEDDLTYIVMRLLRGGTLSDLLDSGPLPVEQAVELFSQFAQGLAYAHSKGVLHRDLKPSNIMLDDAGNAYLTDFGLAKVMGSNTDLTKTGNIVGTPTYMSPEQLRGEPLDPRSDIYSLGVVLYHMVTGRPPFEASSDVITVIYDHLEKTPPPPSQLNRELPPDIEAVILKALAKKPDDRFETVTQMSRELKLALGLGSSQEPRPIVPLPTLERPARPPQRTAVYILGGAVAFLAIIGLIGILLLSASQPPDAAAAQTSTAQALTENPVTPSITTVLKGESADADDIVPTEAEVAAAQAALGPDGFIAYITCNQSSEYHATQAREIREFAQALGLEVRIYDSDTDAYRQLTLIERARGDGAKSLIICPLDIELVDPTLQAASAAGLPMVLFDSGPDSHGAVVLRGDNYELGRKPGRFAGQLIRDELGGEADVIILDYPELPIIVERADGLQDGVKELAPNVNIIGRFKGATRDFGKESVSRLIADGVHFDVILSINDAGSFGAIDALLEAGFARDSVIITSVDAELLAQQYIREGTFMRGSVEVGRTEFSKAAVDAMVRLLAGTPIAETIQVPPGEVVTREVLERRSRSSLSSG